MLKITRFEIDHVFEGLPPPLLEPPTDELETKAFDAIKNAGGFMWLVGSRSIRHAATPDSDYDFLVITRQRIPEVINGELGFELDSGGAHYDPSEGQFNSWRKDRVNLIATDDQRFAKRFLAANEAAKRIGLLRREDRVTLFEAVLYGRLSESKHQWEAD
ncbi:hypothetical protein [Ponticaulis sp.]|uniref:hypothetical protein n=1 Tax=Ponticaulis sp. TaxID=2020902 RepID=UPI000C6AB23E|nr:hypothetical protein [Ponticaulis sp.]MBN04493.1 hypothetical protein [Ponticaulis sp.]